MVPTPGRTASSGKMCGNGCPAKTSFQSREVRDRDDFWVAELSIGYDGGPENFGISILELRGDKIARESICVTEGLRRRSGGHRRTAP